VPVEVKGLIELKKALKDYAPELGEQLDAEVGAALHGVVTKAQGYVPNTIIGLSNWGYRKRSETNGAGVRKFPLYSPIKVIRGIGLKTTPRKANRAGFKAVYYIYNKNAAGAIYETSGRKNSGGQPWVGPQGDRSNHKVSHSNNPNAGEWFIGNMGPLFQGNVESSTKKGRYMQGRLIYRAWGEDQGKANAAVFKAIQKAADQFSKKQYFRKAA
jgi:hypothetical protein